MITRDIRAAFLSYFSANGHTALSSSPLVPQDDPSLLFTSAGMVPFKKIFMGQEQAAHEACASVQKCLRAGGKHNDLDNVGYTARHHTFFEMLGNFSFGAYFKEEAINYAWSFLTKILGIDKQRLYVTYYAEDKETASLWASISGLPSSRILPISSEDNFWSMGDVGPCGPCTEIFYDHGENIAGGLPGTETEDGDRFVEIWNLVFMSYDKGNNMAPLPVPCIDTGAGLERLAAVMQGVTDNFDTDILSRLRFVSSSYLGNDHKDAYNGHKVIADHVRAAAFLIADGVLPENEGRGYVLRRIIRRAARYVYTMGSQEPHLTRLIPELCLLMGEAYPELIRAQSLIEQCLKDEETKFLSTIDKGMRFFSKALESTNTVFSGKDAFKLYDTYGFPLDLTEDILRQQGIKIDKKGFHTAMLLQQELSRAQWAGSGGVVEDHIWFSVKKNVRPTLFIGYECLHAVSKIVSLVKDGDLVDSVTAGDIAYIIVEETPFYAESGGQVGDVGIISCSDGGQCSVTHTEKKVGTLYAHKVSVDRGALCVGDTVNLSVDKEHRQAVAANHSATHLLHHALRERFGDTAIQKGSLVRADKLRFDVALRAPLTIEDREAIEVMVDRDIRSDAHVHVRCTSYNEAMSTGALGLFGEKYGDTVRVVSMGDSQELCGGTHVNSLGQIGSFFIIKEEGISSGVRRIEAVTGALALAHMHKLMRERGELEKVLKTTVVVETVKKLQVDIKRLRKEKEGGKAQSTGQTDVKVCSWGRLHFRRFEGVSLGQMRSFWDKDKQSAGVHIYVSSDKNKHSVLIGVSSSLSSLFDARELLSLCLVPLGGKGGGRRDMAQGGGVGDIEKALCAVSSAISSAEVS